MAAAEIAAKQAAEKKAQAEGEQKIAALAPLPSQPSLSPQETAKLLQAELRRVGCLATTTDSDGSEPSQRSLALFNKYAGTKFDAKLATPDALDAIRAKPGRVCPLICNHGFKSDGSSCVKIACRPGFRVNDDNECAKVQDKKPVATRDENSRRDAERKQIESTPPKREAKPSGQIYCNGAGCRPVRPGCRLVEWKSGSGVIPSNTASGGGSTEVCN